MNYYWKYQKYHWKNWLSSFLLSILFGPVIFFLNCIFMSIAYYFDRNNAEKEMKMELRHNEIIDAINTQISSECVDYKKEENHENIKGPWGEA